MRWIALACLFAGCDQGKLEPPPGYRSDSLIAVHELVVSQMEPPHAWSFRHIKLFGDGTLMDSTNRGYGAWSCVGNSRSSRASLNRCSSYRSRDTAASN